MTFSKVIYERLLRMLRSFGRRRAVASLSETIPSSLYGFSFTFCLRDLNTFAVTHNKPKKTGNSTCYLVYSAHVARNLTTVSPRWEKTTKRSRKAAECWKSYNLNSQVSEVLLWKSCRCGASLFQIRFCCGPIQRARPNFFQKGYKKPAIKICTPTLHWKLYEIPIPHKTY